MIRTVLVEDEFGMVLLRQNPRAVLLFVPSPLLWERAARTFSGFDVPLRGSAYDRLPGVLEALFAAGGSVIDSSPMYGRAETVAGALLAASNTHDQAFLATKVWTRGRDAG